MSRLRHGGFTLIEVLITVVIFSVGLLTVASLQIVARKANFEAVQRTAASHLAQSMLERMRANRPGLAIYVDGGERILLGNTMTAGNDCRNRAAPCVAADLARADLREWEQLLAGSLEVADGAGVGGLVSPTACIRGDGAGGNGAYSVSIAWRSSSESQVEPDDNCGSANAAYGTPPGEFRRVVTVTTFISLP